MHLIGNFIICWENAFSDNMEFHQNVGHFYNLNLGHLREKVKYCVTDFSVKGKGIPLKSAKNIFRKKGGGGNVSPFTPFF